MKCGGEVRGGGGDQSVKQLGEKKGHVTRPAARRCDQLSDPHLLVCFSADLSCCWLYLGAASFSSLVTDVSASFPPPPPL